MERVEILKTAMSILRDLGNFNSRGYLKGKLHLAGLYVFQGRSGEAEGILKGVEE